MPQVSLLLRFAVRFNRRYAEQLDEMEFVESSGTKLRLAQLGRSLCGFRGGTDSLRFISGARARRSVRYFCVYY